MDSAAAGSGKLVVAEGASGMGKAALLDYALEYAHATGMKVLRCAVSEFETDYAFGTVLTLFLNYLSGLDRVARDGLLTGRAAICKSLFDHTDRALKRVVDNDQFPFIDGLYWLTVNITHDGPVIVLIDDIHCADRGFAPVLDLPDPPTGHAASCHRCHAA
ncbi:hypothetical protein AWC19_27835 [Mycobacterium palustre]|uniref:Orc1-like AAA ATPase domain-containing protein n=2 Tax=Mycobacterium palustre TaxID=153971 RepID=A0A1X1ZWG4_9MYCO|nr:hypothetical protein AWC19_27835 [Mycobacterium palustre]